MSSKGGVGGDQGLAAVSAWTPVVAEIVEIIRFRAQNASRVFQDANVGVERNADAQKRCSSPRGG